MVAKLQDFVSEPLPLQYSLQSRFKQNKKALTEIQKRCIYDFQLFAYIIEKNKF